MKNKQGLQVLGSVGPRIEEDLHRLDIFTIQDLVGQNAREMYDRLKALNGGAYLDMCVLDVFTCVIAQAENPDLPDEQKQWHFWSKVRKGQK